VINATFSNISVISWRPVLVMEKAGENHRPRASNWLIRVHLFFYILYINPTARKLITLIITF